MSACMDLSDELETRGRPSPPRNVILLGDVFERLAELPDESVHMVVTSPPYWTQRDYGVEGQLGLEPTLEAYVETQVRVFREVRRVLRSDGSLWLNIGDAYATRNGQHSNGRGLTAGPKHAAAAATRMRGRKMPAGYKDKDLLGIPWELALALRRDGWWLRRDNVWYKPNPTPESATDRSTTAHEYVFHLTKRGRYFYDQEATREPFKGKARDQAAARAQRGGTSHKYSSKPKERRGIKPRGNAANTTGRNPHSVWTIATEPSRLAHYATFPKRLALRCILAGTSERGVCSACGAPWVRILEVVDPAGRLGKSYHDHKNDLKRGQRGIPYAEGAPVKRTVGWRPTCDHEAPTARALVLDPFMGTGTTAVVCARQGRDYLGIELSEEYVAIAEERLVHERRLL